MTARETCCKCEKRPRTPGQRWCRLCHNAYMRQWRRDQPLNSDQRKKDIARSYAAVYLRRGKLTRKPCRKCGSNNSQMHHPNYSKPLNVVWLCRKHHLELHARKRQS